MSLARINRNFIIKALKTQRFYATTLKEREDEYTDTPVYPEIQDLSFKKRRERQVHAQAEEIKTVKTIEEKQIKLNMPRYYGFKCCMFHEDFVPHNCLPLTQYTTRTHFIQEDDLPGYYKDINVDDLVQKLKSEIEEVLILEYTGYQKSHEITGTKLDKREADDLLSLSISRHVNRIILNNLSSNFPHLQTTQTDFEPRIESFWVVGGMDPPKSVKSSKKSVEWMKDMADDPVDRNFYYTGTPNLTVRWDIPLNPILSYEEVQNHNFTVPDFRYDPNVITSRKENRRIVNTPGFWPGDANEFGLLSFHRRGHLIDREFYDIEESKEPLHRQGILTSFGWLNAQANFLGFNTFNDLTYPLVNQCVITNGQLWSFYVYQLNTILMYHNHWQTNPKKNVCWGTKEMKLFEEVKDEKIVGFNDEVLKLLLKFYANVPQNREGIELRPYLSKEEKVIADYKDDDKRQWLEREYKFLTSNRPRYALPYEIYHWEKIYKIDHNRRPMDARRRPFELFIDPLKRRLDERLAIYIPRKHRPDLPRHKGRYAKEYFP